MFCYIDGDIFCGGTKNRINQNYVHSQEIRRALILFLYYCYYYVN